MEAIYLEQKRNTKRRLMESNQVGAEVRRIHVIYFLSRKGRIEHPHLIRVHHLSRNGVHLRDVKRWLGELRGKDMPESFSWSYKRRYRSGYVWQDLLDEDLITPISDNEFVLKGSEISSIVTIEDSPSEKRYSMQKEEEDSDRTPSSSEENQDDHHHHQETKMDQPTKISSPEIEEESPTFGSEKSSTLTDDSMKTKDQDQGQEKNSSYQTPKEEMREESDKSESSSYYSPLSSKRNKKANNVMSGEKISAPSSSASTSSTAQPSFSKSRSYSNASHLFRNLITCGAVETNDSVMVTINRRNKPPTNANLSSLDKQNQVSNATKELLQKGDKLGGSQRIFGTNWNQQRQSSGRISFDGVRASQKNNGEFNSQKTNAAYKPIYGPPCSQCGKPFKPEKLHAHMKSCKGMKAWAKYSGPAISTATADKPAESPHENLAPGYYLTH